METRVHYILIGLFVLVLGAAATGGVLWLGMGPSTKNYGRYQVYMTESVAGLTRDAAVKYKGVDVGRVARISLDQENPEQVQLLLEIEAGTPIREDTQAILEFQGLTGLAYVNLQSKSGTAAPLTPSTSPPYPEIKSGPSLLMRLDEGVSRLLASLTQTSESIREMLAGPEKKDIGASIAHLEKILNTLAGRTEDMQRAIEAAAHTMQQSAKASDNLPELLARLNQAGAGLTQMADEIRAQSKEIGHAAGSGVAGINRVVEEGGQELRAMSANLQQLIQRLDELAARLEENPDSLLFGRPRPAPGPGEQTKKAHETKVKSP